MSAVTAANYAQPDPRAYQDRDLHELHRYEAAMALSGPQRWLLAQESFRISCQPGRQNLAAGWKAAADGLLARGYAERSRSGRYWITGEGRAVIGAIA